MNFIKVIAKFNFPPCITKWRLASCLVTSLFTLICFLSFIYICLGTMFLPQTKGEMVSRDFNIQNEAGGSKKALVKTFEANVTNTIIDIHFFWAGKGTCCIPFQSTYGPLVSAIHVSQGSPTTFPYIFHLFSKSRTNFSY